jgi:RNA polymerase sigma factor (sigma-70 family)
MKDIVYDLGVLLEIQPVRGVARRDQVEEVLFRRHMDRLLQAVDTCVKTKMTAKQREVLLLYYKEQQNMTQIGRQLGVGRAAVSRRLSRARLTLKEALTPYLEE